jgi:cytosolic prostaglandin-E synthase
LKFKGKSNDKDYEVDIVFFKAVNAEGSTYKVLPRSIQMHILKKDKEDEEFWPRLLKDKLLEKNQVKIDWDRYVDEDEEEEGFDMSNLEGGMGMGGGGGMPGGMDMEAMMQQMGGMGGMGGGGK